jgi:hypothetical protein
MNSSHAITRQFPRTSTVTPVVFGYRDFDTREERATDAVMLSTLVVAIILLYSVLFASAYLWSRYAPVFPPDFSDGSAIAQALPWSQ